MYIDEVRNGYYAVGTDAPLLGLESAQNPSGDIIGPTLPVADPSADTEDSIVPSSPYSAARSLVHDLTLPTNPNLDIPPSPPGSPPPGVDQKFSHFRELKQQGIHFNEKLAHSSALKNPSLLARLMNAAGVSADQQYDTTLPNNLWDLSSFPPWAFKEELAKSQQEMLKRKEEERARSQRENINFVSASASGNSSRAGTPSSNTGPKGLRGSVAERVMAGLDKERSRSPHTSASANRGANDKRTTRFHNEDRQDRARVRSKWPRC